MYMYMYICIYNQAFQVAIHKTKTYSSLNT